MNETLLELLQEVDRNVHPPHINGVLSVNS